MRGWIHCAAPACAVGGSYPHLADFKDAFGMDGSLAGSLPAFVSGASLAGLDVINGADYPLLSDGARIYCDFPAYTSPGSPYGYDGTAFFFSGIVRCDFDFSYEYRYEYVPGVFTGAKNLICVANDPALWDHAGLHIGTWGDAGSFPANPLRLSLDESWLSHIIEEIDPVEAAGLNLPSTYDTWFTRRMVKRGPVIEYTDGGAGPVALRRCWLNLAGAVGLIISGGVRVRNLAVS